MTEEENPEEQSAEEEIDALRERVEEAEARYRLAEARYREADKMLWEASEEIRRWRQPLRPLGDSEAVRIEVTASLPSGESFHARQDVSVLALGGHGAAIPAIARAVAADLGESLFAALMARVAPKLGGARRS